MRRLALPCRLAGALFGLLLAAAQAAAQSEPTVVALRYGAYVDTTVSARVRHDSLLLPLRTVVATLGGTAVYTDEGVHGTFDRLAFRVPLRGDAVRGRLRVPVVRTSLERDDDLYVPTVLLDTLFGVRIAYDPSTLTAHVAAARRLPVAEAHARRAARRALEASFATGPPPPVLPPPPPRWASGAVVGYAFTAGREEGRSLATLDVRGGAEVLGGSFETGVVGTLVTDVPRPTNARLAPTAWHLAAQDPLFQYAGIGDIASQGLQSFGLLGVVATNAPYPVREAYDALPLTGFVAPRAEVEVYRNGRLVAFTRADDTGAFEVRLPSSYGTSEVEIRELDPGGGQRSTFRRVSVPPSLVRPGQVEYTLSGGFLRQQSTLTVARPLFQRPVIQSQAAWGVTPSLTLRTGAEWMDLGRYRGTLAYGGATARVGDRAVVSLDVAPGVYQRLAGVVYGGRLGSVQVQAERFPTLVSPYNLLGVRHATSVTANVHVRRATLTLLASHGQQADRTTLRSVQAIASGPVRSALVTVSVGQRLRALAGGTTRVESARLEAAVLLPMPGGPRALAGSLLRGFAAVDAHQRRLERIGVGLMRGLPSGWRLGLSVGYRTFPQAGPMLSLDLATERPVADVAVRAEQNGEAQRASVTVRSSAVVDPTSPHGAHFVRQNWVGGGGIRPVFYEDRDGDGRRSARDRTLDGPSLRLDGPGARFRVGDNPRLTGLVPFFTYTAFVESGPLVDPSLVPQHGAFRFVSSPNHLQEIEVPFVRGGDLTGRLVADDGAGGVSIPEGLLVHFSTDGVPAQRTFVFSDGTFEQTGLLPGRYRVRLDAQQLRLAGLAAEPLEATVEIVGGAPSAPVTFAVRPR